MSDGHGVWGLNTFEGACAEELSWSLAYNVLECIVFERFAANRKQSFGIDAFTFSELRYSSLPCSVWNSLLIQVCQRESSNQYRNLKFTSVHSSLHFVRGKQNKLCARNHPISITKLCGGAQLCKHTLLPPNHFKSGDSSWLTMPTLQLAGGSERGKESALE
jgi:hypothetical protein